MKPTFPEDPRFKQCDKETWIMVGILILNILWWFAFAYGLGSRPPEEYTYILGLPAWFFLSCVAGYVFFTLLVWLAVRLFFKDIPLDEAGQEAGRSERP